jgi:hypothetical protein
MCNPGRSSRAIPNWQLTSVPHAIRSGSTRTDSQRRWPSPLCGPPSWSRDSAPNVPSPWIAPVALAAPCSLVPSCKLSRSFRIVVTISAFLPIPSLPPGTFKRYTNVALSYPHACARASNIFDPYRAATNRPKRGAIPRHASLTAPFLPAKRKFAVQKI